MRPGKLWTAAVVAVGFLVTGSISVSAAEEPSASAGQAAGGAAAGETATGESSSGSDQPQDGDVVPNQYIVVFEDAVDDVAGTAVTMAVEHRGEVRHVYDDAFEGFSTEMSDEEAAELAEDPGVASVVPNRVFTVDQEVQEDPPWGLDRIDQRDPPVDDRYTYTHTGAGVDVYVLDSGIRTTHDDFAGRATVGTDFVDDGQDGQDCLGHGTGVAGIVGGAEHGVAKDVNLVAVRIADCVGAGVRDNFLAGIEWVIDNADGPSVANMSFSWEDGTDPEAEAVDALVDAGVVPVVTGGNVDQNVCDVRFPAMHGDVITVSSANDDDERHDGHAFGPCIDVYGPGVDVPMPDIDDDQDTREATGTSFAAPHVSGVAALYLESEPAAGPATVRSAIVDNATPDRLTDPDTGDTTLPDGTANRLLYSRFLDVPAEPPVADAGGPYSGDEGSAVSFDGTGSSHPGGEPLTYQWDFGDGSTGTGPTPSHTYLDDGDYTVTLTVTAEGLSDSDTTTASIANVAPTVTIDPDQVTTIDEGDTVEVTAQFSDPGILDEPFTADVDWGVPAGQEGDEVSPPSVTITDPGGGGAPLEGEVTASYTYGDVDDGSGFEIDVTVTDKDGGSGSDSFDLTVGNVDPEVSITSDVVMVGGVPTIIGRVGEELTIESLTEDPGSDDLTLGWDLGDGTTSERLSLVNPPDEDPLPSPTVQPRSESDEVGHTYEKPCLYEVEFTATDDDGGSESTTVAVVITGDADHPLPATLWYTQYHSPLLRHIDEETLQCYLDISDHMSQVFGEERPLEDFDDATDVLHPPLIGGERTDKLDRQLLAAWLNFAHGPYDLDELIDTDRDHEPDTEFWDALQGAEEVRLDPDSTHRELHDQSRLLRRINHACAPPDGLVNHLRCVALGLLPG